MVDDAPHRDAGEAGGDVAGGDDVGDVAGVVFPLVDGRRSSTATGQAVLASAARAISPDLASAIEAESDWYGRYVDHTLRLEEAQLADPAGADRVPAAGLAAVADRMVFVREGESLRLDEALRRWDEPGFATATVEGAGERITELRIPYAGRELEGDDLRRQVGTWVDRGVIEPSAGAALHLVLDHPDWLDCRDTTVAVLGGAAEMGPLGALARWGADLLVVDLPRPDLWTRILSLVRRGAGRAFVPAPRDGGAWATDPDRLADVAGADLARQTPEVAAWLDQADGPLVVGNYVYADGPANVVVSTAVDAIFRRLADGREEVTYAVLATPTDVYAVPADAVEASQEAFARRPARRRVAGAVSAGRLYAPNYPPDETGSRSSGAAAGAGSALDDVRSGRRVVDCQIPQQGCNYSLAKRLHRWGARAARASGRRASINVAPATWTASVTSNRVLAAAYSGGPAFGIEVFEPATSRALMAALLVHDLRNPDAVAAPTTPLDHPLDLLAEGACHGGLWRNPYAPRTVLPVAAARGLFSRRTWR